MTILQKVEKLLEKSPEGLTFGQISIQLNITSQTLSPVLSRAGKKNRIYKHLGLWAIHPLRDKF